MKRIKVDNTLGGPSQKMTVESQMCILVPNSFFPENSVVLYNFAHTYPNNTHRYNTYVYVELVQRPRPLEDTDCT